MYIYINIYIYIYIDTHAHIPSMYRGMQVHMVKFAFHIEVSSIQSRVL